MSISRTLGNRKITIDTKTEKENEKVIKDLNNDWTINYVAYKQFKTASGY